MWAMIPMLRVFSRVNLRGMDVSLVSFFVRVPGESGQKNGPYRAQVMHVERPDGSKAMSRGSPCEGPGLRQQATAVHSSKAPSLDGCPMWAGREALLSSRHER